MDKISVNVTDSVYGSKHNACNSLHNTSLHNGVVFLEGAQNESTEFQRVRCFFYLIIQNTTRFPLLVLLLKDPLRVVAQTLVNTNSLFFCLLLDTLIPRWSSLDPIHNVPNSFFLVDFVKTRSVFQSLLNSGKEIKEIGVCMHIGENQKDNICLSDDFIAWEKRNLASSILLGGVGCLIVFPIIHLVESLDKVGVFQLGEVAVPND